MRGIRIGAARVVCLAAAGCVVCGAAASAAAQEGETATIEKRWSNEAQLSYVRASGNSAAVTVAVANRLTYNWQYSELVAFGEAFRTTTTERELFNESGLVREQLRTRIATERYELGAKFRRNVLGNVFWYVGGGWYRNRPSGIDSRLTGSGGVGYRFVESASSLFVVEGGVGVSRETPVDGVADTFAEGRAAVDLRRQLSANAELAAGGELLQNLQNTADRRINLRAALTASVVDSLALRFGWNLKYDADPPLLLVATVPAEPPALYRVGTSDHTFSASLVVTF